MAAAVVQVRAPDRSRPAHYLAVDDSVVAPLLAGLKHRLCYFGWNVEEHVGPHRGDAHPQFVVLDERKDLLEGDRILVPDDQEPLFVVHELRDVFAEEGEGRVGDHNVRLLQQPHALGAAEVTAPGEACARVGVLLQEQLDVFDAGSAISVDILHFLDLDGDRLGLLALAIPLVVLTERELSPGDRGTVVAGGDELLEAELVEVGGEVLEEIALERVVAIAVDYLAAEGVGVKLQVSLDLFLDVHVLGVELVLLGRLRGVQASV